MHEVPITNILLSSKYNFDIIILKILQEIQLASFLFEREQATALCVSAIAFWGIDIWFFRCYQLQHFGYLIIMAYACRIHKLQALFDCWSFYLLFILFLLTLYFISFLFLNLTSLMKRDSTLMSRWYDGNFNGFSSPWNWSYRTHHHFWQRKHRFSDNQRPPSGDYVLIIQVHIYGDHCEHTIVTHITSRMS